MSLFIGIDSGTQSVKGIALDLDTGKVVAEARAPHALIGGLPPGHMEQHPEMWRAALDRVLAGVAKAIDGRRVRGIGVSGQQHGFVPLDAQGRVIRPAKLWCDTSTTAECELLTKKLGGTRAAIARVGLSFLPGYTAPKILWLKRHEPANYRRLRHVLLPHDYLNFHLTGEYTMEFGDASGTALFDVRRRVWSAAAIRAIDPHLADWLPTPGPSDRPAGTLRSELAQRYGFPEGVVVSAGGGDNMMAAIGTGNVAPGIVTASLGTSGTIYACAARPVVDPRGEIAAFCSSTGGWLPLLCTLNATGVTEAVRSLFGFDYAALDAAAASTAAGSGGLLLLPYFSGERTPNVPDGTGVLFGLTHQTCTPGHIARAAMEGVALGMNYGLQRLAALGVRPREIRLTGGGARSAVWRQIAADVFGASVVAMREDEGAALGAALQAGWCHARLNGRPGAKIMEFTKPVVALNESTRCRPHKGRHALYAAMQTVQDKLSVTLRRLFAEKGRIAAWAIVWVIAGMSWVPGGGAAPALPSKEVLGTTFYPWGSLVSVPTRDGSTRMVIDAPTPTLERLMVHITSMKPEAPYPLHHHPDEEVVVVKEGSVRYQANGRTFDAGPGDFVFLSADAVHTPYNITPATVVYYVINFVTEKTPRTPGPPADTWARPEELHSGVIEVARLPVEKTPTGTRRKVISSPTATLLRLESHINTLAPGKSTHTGIDPADELVIIESGRIEAHVNNTACQLAAASLFFRASNDPHSMKNIGSGPASYQTIRFVTARTPQKKTTP